MTENEGCGRHAVPNPKVEVGRKENNKTSQEQVTAISLHISIQSQLSLDTPLWQVTSWLRNSHPQYTLLSPRRFHQTQDPQPLSKSKQKLKISSLNYSTSPLTPIPWSRSMAKYSLVSGSKSIPNFLPLLSSNYQENL